MMSCPDILWKNDGKIRRLNLCTVKLPLLFSGATSFQMLKDCCKDVGQVLSKIGYGKEIDKFYCTHVMYAQ